MTSDSSGNDVVSTAQKLTSIMHTTVRYGTDGYGHTGYLVYDDWFGGVYTGECITACAAQQIISGVMSNPGYPTNGTWHEVYIDCPPGTTGGGGPSPKTYTINGRLGMKGTVVAANGRLTWNITAPVIASFTYGYDTDIPLVGDWNGDGVEGIGAYEPASTLFYLKDNPTQGNADYSIPYGVVGDTPLSWYDAALGNDSFGILRAGEYYLRNHLTSGIADIVAPANEVSCYGSGIVGQCLYSATGIPPPTAGISSWVWGAGVFVGGIITIVAYKKHKKKPKGR